ncbi:MAG: hypothetical protein LBG28_05775 [Tannerella sp.]|jgi:hypothetical protein|nr:hypothetical protein [Tannerella sp.]
MNDLILILIQWTVDIYGVVDSFFASDADIFNNLITGGATSLALAAGVSPSNIPEEIRNIVRQWHGSIDKKFTNIDNLVLTIQAHSTWGTPPQFSLIVSNRALLAALIPKCKSPQGSSNDRARRSTLLKTTVDLCIGTVKLWAYNMYNVNPNVFTIDDLHSLGFLLPGETGGRHSRTEATDATAEVKVIVLSSDRIKVVIDKAVGENAALTKHAWPSGVRMAIIVILAVDDNTEIIRMYTSRLSNKITMPQGSHGKAFIAKAAFLRHVDDAPIFGPQPTFTMPFSTEDLTKKDNSNDDNKQTKK